MAERLQLRPRKPRIITFLFDVGAIVQVDKGGLWPVEGKIVGRIPCEPGPVYRVQVDQTIILFPEDKLSLHKGKKG